MRKHPTNLTHPTQIDSPQSLVRDDLATGASSATGVTTVYGDNDSPFFWTATNLANKLRDYQRYYNEHRTHAGREGATPVIREPGDVIDIRDYRWETHCRALFQLPVAA